MTDGAAFKYSFYHKETGEIHPMTLVTSDPAVANLNVPENHTLLFGHHDSACRRVDVVTGKVHAYQPEAPSPDHEWHEASERWQLKAHVAQRHLQQTIARARIAVLESTQQPRAQRELLLAIADKVGITDSRLHEIETQIAAQRTVLNAREPNSDTGRTEID